MKKNSDRKASDCLASHKKIITDTGAVGVLNSMPDSCILFDSTGCAVYCNKAFTGFYGKKSKDILGKKFGEIICCPNTEGSHLGCGFTDFCGECPYNMTLRKQGKDAAEMRIFRRRRTAEKHRDIRMFMSVVELCGESFRMLTLRDISDQKLKEVLNRTFIHDILNTASGLNLMVQLALAGDGGDTIIPSIEKQSKYLIEELKTHRELLCLKKVSPGDYVFITSDELIRMSAGIMEHFAENAGVEMVVVPGGTECTVKTNPILMRRVLVNLLKNAVEASVSGQKVVAGCREEDSFAVFYVANESVMPKEVRDSLFKRRYSTKSKDRGTGALSTKVLTEVYLNGRIEFVSEPENGTVFYIRIPKVTSSAAMVSCGCGGSCSFCAGEEKRQDS